MRASSRYRPLVYVLDPQRRKYDQFGMVLGDTLPFRIEFRGQREGFFDSETIADPEKRARAESFLLSHPDNGKMYHIERDVPVRASKNKIKLCIATLHLKGEPSKMCGKPATEGLDYCDECAEVETKATA